MKPYKYSFEVNIYPNPYRISGPKDNAQFYSTLDYTPQNSTNTAIVVSATGSRKISGELEGRVTIFDPLGHVVHISHDMTFVKSTEVLVSEFNGRNRNGRYLSSGNYHAIIVISGSAVENPQKLTARIGVQSGVHH